jgi:phospholipid/cholesterol/gamma-HCH transport system permease protein
MTVAARDGWLDKRETADSLVLSLGGRWDMRCAERHEKALSRLETASGQALHIDFSAIESLDTAGAWLLHRMADRLRGEGVKVFFDNLPPAQADLLERLGRIESHIEIEPPRRNPLITLLALVGRSIIEIGVEVMESIAFLGLTLTCLARAAARPRLIRWPSIFYHLEQAGLNAIPIIALISFLIGLVIAYQGSVQLRQFGAEIFVVDMVAISVLRELAILLTAIVVAGRSGSAFTAQIGAMKINEEVDAMRTLGLDPMQVLVVPRLIALMIALPLLGFVADVMGLLGGGVMTMIELGISPAQFLDRLGTSFAPWSLGTGLIKAPVFAAIVALTSCHMGMKVTGSSESVGKLTTRSVVHAIFAVIVADALFSIFFAYIGI